MGFEVSKQPPWSIAISTKTQPFFRNLSVFFVINFGAFAPGIRTAPIMRSLLIAFSYIFFSLDKIHFTLPLNKTLSYLIFPDLNLKL